MPTDSWTTCAAVKAKVVKTWESGALLRELHLDPDQRRVFPLRLRLVGPQGEELRAHLSQARTWARRLHDESTSQGWRLETRMVSAGALGRQQLPVAAWLDTPEQALAMLGPERRKLAATFAVALEQAIGCSAGRDVALDKPHLVLAATSDWPTLLGVVNWLVAHPRSGVLARQIPVPGMHTKLVEQRRALLTRLLDAALPAEAVDRDASSWFARYGLAAPVRQVRLRAEGAIVGLPHLPDADVTWPIEGLAGVDSERINDLVVVENVISFHAVPMMPGRIALFGGGYAAADALAGLPWLSRVPVRYWGDIDTHGFAILAAVRQVAPQVESIMMDEATLVAHRDHWVIEPAPFTDDLTSLTPEEQAVFDLLRARTLGSAVRLEQEFIRFDLVESAFA